MYDWDFRIIKDGAGNFYVAEVYYRQNGSIEGWADYSPDLLIMDDYENLKGTAEEIMLSFSKPILAFNGMELVDV